MSEGIKRIDSKRDIVQRLGIKAVMEGGDYGIGDEVGCGTRGEIDHGTLDEIDDAMMGRVM